jgi:phage repressor protein C with HTH and peptisase S24 domain
VDYGERIKHIRGLFFMNQTQFATYTNTARSALSEFENDVREPSKDFIITLKDIGVSIDWFLTGEGNPLTPGLSEALKHPEFISKNTKNSDKASRLLNLLFDGKSFPLKSNKNSLSSESDRGMLKSTEEESEGPPSDAEDAAEERGVTAVAERTKKTRPRIAGEIPIIYAGDDRLRKGIVIPFLEDQAISAGPGADLDEGDNPSQYLRVPEYLARYPDLAMLPVRGDSMDPTLHDGDLVVCDGGGWDGDGIYVIKTTEKSFVKRVVSTSKGYQVISDNKMYPSYSESSEDMTIVGKVRAAVIMMPGRRGGI